MCVSGLFLGFSPALFPPLGHKPWHRSRLPTFFGGTPLGHRLGPTLSRGFNHKLMCVCMYGAGGHRGDEREREVIVADIMEEYEEMVPKRTVAVFWDLDNKPPNTVPPYDAALRLKRLAGEFGEVVDMVAYANKNAFSYVPQRVRVERQDRRTLDKLEKMGVVKVDHPYICTMCGRKCKTNIDLKKHFKQLHERERNKRMSYVGQLKGRKKIKFLEKVAAKEFKYKEAARTVILPKVGYGLASDLKRAGVVVRTVEKRPQAADDALVRHMTLYISRGIECIFLISDDSDFREILRVAKKKHVCTVVVGDTSALRGVADTCFSWEDVESGRAIRIASERLQMWTNEDALRSELLRDDEFEDEADGANFSDSEEDFQDFQRRLRSSVKISAFAEDEADYYSDEDEEYIEEDRSNYIWDCEVDEAVKAEGTI